MGTRAGVSSHSAIEGSNFELTSGDPGAPVLSSESKGRAVGSGFLVSATVLGRTHTRQCRQGREGLELPASECASGNSAFDAPHFRATAPHPALGRVRYQNCLFRSVA